MGVAASRRLVHRFLHFGAVVSMEGVAFYGDGLDAFAPEDSVEMYVSLSSCLAPDEPVTEMIGCFFDIDQPLTERNSPRWAKSGERPPCECGAS